MQLWANAYFVIIIFDGSGFALLRTHFLELLNPIALHNCQWCKQEVLTQKH